MKEIEIRLRYREILEKVLVHNATLCYMNKMKKEENRIPVLSNDNTEMILHLVKDASAKVLAPLTKMIARVERSPTVNENSVDVYTLNVPDSFTEGMQWELQETAEGNTAMEILGLTLRIIDPEAAEFYTSHVTECMEAEADKIQRSGLKFGEYRLKAWW